MGSPAVQLMLESVLIPIVLAGVVLMSARRFPQERVACAEALAIVLAVGTTYVLAFGWPLGLVFSAKLKIVLSAFGGLLIGMAIEQRTRWARLGLVAGTIGIPIWVGFPLIEQGRPESILILLPITAALAVPQLIGKTPTDRGASKTLIALSMAVSLAVIATLAKALSFAELCLSLSSALLAILLISPKPPLGAPAALAAAAMLLALVTALLLYSEASPLALSVLGIAVGAERLASLTSSKEGAEMATRRIFAFCALPAILSILIARIDAGPFSLY